MNETMDSRQLEEQRDELARIDDALASTRIEALLEHDILLSYQRTIARGAPYSAADKNWITNLVIDSRSAQGAQRHAPSPSDTFDKTRPLISTAYHRASELGAAWDMIRALLAKQKAARKKLEIGGIKLGPRQSGPCAERAEAAAQFAGGQVWFAQGSQSERGQAQRENAKYL